MDTRDVKSSLQSMDDYGFEHFVADLWERQGWDCVVSQASMDAGIDVIATKSEPYEQKKLIQAKRYGPNTSVGGPDIQQYASLKHQQPDADSVIVVTTSRFTRSAEERADELNVKLVDGDRLKRMIDRHNAYDLVQEYAPHESTAKDSSTTPKGESISDNGMGNVKTTAQTSDSDGGRHRNFVLSWEWHRILPVAIGVWFIAIMIAGTLDGTEIMLLNVMANLIGLTLVLPLFVGIPLIWYFDMKRVRIESDWDPTAIAYLIGGVALPFIAFPLYYYRRYKAIGL